MAIAVYDALQDVPAFPHPEVVEFARHLRNAAAHDMHIHITGPAGRAEFSGITIDRSDHGKALSEVIGLGGVHALLDFVIEELRAPA